MTTTPAINRARSTTARLLATEVLLAEPEALGDDVLEACLYILHDRLTGQRGENQ